ncbi:oxytocin-neurophysin 1-like [Dendroctonus ponderosae]|uniref:Uncharacterized protein n=1 Tax=Dendroctonus ponderosae TaxID=77166 RepID=A0AAR5PIS0_DENPD|nr:oxytocin-neurophysin 1-like [Dendroctonus ponderosae]KAH1015842.1 hypothetical protein HUJ04_007165 [Dendroctonus ponderosae]KAH1025116.1 hypothetical protein HUJ05_009908 [Dendroctonus ponderosae]
MTSRSSSKIAKMISQILMFILLSNILVSGCLITNCPRGGKRSGKYGLSTSNNIKQCIPCGPGGAGQCFGPSICCGPFGCLLGTPETIRCQREGMFHESEPCIAGNSNCRKNTGRCAMDGICCSQDACSMDKQCLMEEKKFIGDSLSTMDLLNILGYQNDGMGIGLEN